MDCISSDLAANRLQLLQEIVPRLSRVAVLFNGAAQAKVDELQDIVAAAKTPPGVIQTIGCWHDSARLAVHSIFTCCAVLGPSGAAFAPRVPMSSWS